MSPVPVVVTTLHALAPDETPKVWLVDNANEQDIEQQIESLVKCVLDVRLRFLGGLHELSASLRALLDESPGALARSGGQVDRCMSLLALWFLLGRASDEGETAVLVEHCRARVRREEVGVAVFESLVDDLKAGRVLPILREFL